MTVKELASQLQQIASYDPDAVVKITGRWYDGTREDLELNVGRVLQSGPIVELICS